MFEGDQVEWWLKGHKSSSKWFNETAVGLLMASGSVAWKWFYVYWRPDSFICWCKNKGLLYRAQDLVKKKKRKKVLIANRHKSKTHWHHMTIKDSPHCHHTHSVSLWSVNLSVKQIRIFKVPLCNDSVRPWMPSVRVCTQEVMSVLTSFVWWQCVLGFSLLNYQRTGNMLPC